jgi:hypothetical protein
MQGHLSKKQGKMVYDVTAKRVGFRERDEQGNYVMNLSEPTLKTAVPGYAPSFGSGVLL